MRGPDFLNVGTGEDVTIMELATIIAQQVGYDGKIFWDETKPDGMARKLLDCTRLLATGFRTEISFETGIAKTIDEYRALKAAGAIA